MNQEEMKIAEISYVNDKVRSRTMPEMQSAPMF